VTSGVLDKKTNIFADGYGFSQRAIRAFSSVMFEIVFLYCSLSLHEMSIFVHVSAQLMSNNGTLFANDASVERAKAIVGNIHRMGIVNCVVSTYDGRKLPKVGQ